MKWERMQKPLRMGLQAFRTSWPDDQYVMLESGRPVLFTAEHPMGQTYSPSLADVAANDWAGTGPSGE